MQAKLISCLGTDLTVVNAARVSFDKESDWEVNHNVRRELSSKDGALIRYLAKHNHFTPFFVFATSIITHVSSSLFQCLYLRIAAPYKINNEPQIIFSQAPFIYLPLILRRGKKGR